MNKVLIIEDETILSLHISKFVKKAGYEVIGCAKNSQDAFRLTKNESFDIVISDIHIDGDLDGIEVSSILQKSYSCKIIFLTAYKDDETVLKASKVDFLGYLLKPFRQEELKTLLKLASLKLKNEYSQFIDLNSSYRFYSSRRELLFNNKSLSFTKKELDLFSLLVKNKNQLLTYDYIDEIIWPLEIVSSNSRRQIIHRLKAKLEGLEIESIKSIGLKLII